MLGRLTSPLEVLIAVDRNGRLRVRVSQFDHEAGRDSIMTLRDGSRADLLRMLSALLPADGGDTSYIMPPGDTVPVTAFDVSLLKATDPIESD